MREEVILVDLYGHPIGIEEKLRAHQNGGRLHQAFSIFIFNPGGEMLLQQRSRKKYHFAELWTNACCSHPRKGEALEDAAHRRLKTEFGFDTELKEVFRFIYRSLDVKSGLTEYEFDHVFTGMFDGEPEPHPLEIDNWKWVDVAALRVDLEEHPDQYTPWFRIATRFLATAPLEGERIWETEAAPAP